MENFFFSFSVFASDYVFFFLLHFSVSFFQLFCVKRIWELLWLENDPSKRERDTETLSLSFFFRNGEIVAANSFYYVIKFLKIEFCWIWNDKWIESVARITTFQIKFNHFIGRSSEQTHTYTRCDVKNVNENIFDIYP